MLDVMKRDFPQVAGTITLQELMDKYVLVGGVRSIVVSEGDSPVGMITLSNIRSVPHVEWPTTTASEVMVRLQKLATTRPDAARCGTPW